MSAEKPPAWREIIPAPTRKSLHKRGPRALARRAALPVLLVLLGALVMAYPVAATLINDARQQRIAQAYSVEVAQTGASRVTQAIQQAHEYNDHLVSKPILDPWLHRVTPDSAPYRQYLGQLNFASEMGRIRIPKIGVNLPILHGTSQETLARGIGHLFGTSLPVGGKSTHAVLTGHSALGTATLFDNLPQLREGDIFSVDVGNETLAYRVRGTRVVLPNQTDTLGAEDGKDLITLITCTPYGVNTHRLLVTAERTSLNPSEAKALTTPPSWLDRLVAAPRWMLIMSALPVAALALMGWLIVGGKRRKKQAEAEILPPAPPA